MCTDCSTEKFEGLFHLLCGRRSPDKLLQLAWVQERLGDAALMDAANGKDPYLWCGEWLSVFHRGNYLGSRKRGVSHPLLINPCPPKQTDHKSQVTTLNILSYTRLLPCSTEVSAVRTRGR